jgi:hypothetical protein
MLERMARAFRYALAAVAVLCFLLTFNSPRDSSLANSRLIVAG